jgi:hypothetical protein
MGQAVQQTGKQVVVKAHTERDQAMSDMPAEVRVALYDYCERTGNRLVGEPYHTPGGQRGSRGYWRAAVQVGMKVRRVWWNGERWILNAQARLTPRYKEGL